MNKLKSKFSNFLYFQKALGKNIYLLVFINIIVGVLDGVGLTIFIPLFELSADSGNQQIENPIIQKMLSLGINFELQNILIILCIVFIGKGIIKYLSQIYQVHLYHKFASNLRKKLVNYFNGLNFKQFLNFKKGELESYITLEVNNLINACRLYLKSIEFSILFFSYIILAFITNLLFTSILVFFGILTNFIFTSLNKQLKKYSLKIVDDNSIFQSYFLQLIGSFKYLSTTNIINRFTEKVNTSVDGVEQNNIRLSWLNAIILSIREPLMIITLALSIYFYIQIFDSSLASIVLSILFFYRGLQSMLQAQINISQFYSASGSLNKILELEATLNSNQRNFGDKEIEEFKSKIELKNVCVSIKEKDILNNINLCIQKNKTTALIGKSGSGKTTLINTLTGLIENSKGTITIDGTNLMELKKESWRSKIGYVSQEPIIFEDTLFNNISLWDERSKANELKVIELINKLELQELLENSNLHEINIGTYSQTLSGGQRQRISIARELYRKPEILFLDEATSALDSITEKIVQKTIKSLTGKTTIIIAAHKLSTIKNSDQIICLDKGNLTEQGTFSTLQKSSSYFKKLIELQQII